MCYVHRTPLKKELTIDHLVVVSRGSRFCVFHLARVFLLEKCHFELLFYTPHLVTNATSYSKSVIKLVISSMRFIIFRLVSV